MRKGILGLCIAIAIIAMMVMPVSAVVTRPSKSNGVPFDNLWNAALDLQAQINALTQKVNKIESTPRPCINCKCPAGQFVTGFDSTGNLVCSGPSPSSPIVPLTKAGTPFTAKKYPQDTPKSDPMVFTATWDGNGRVYISGEATSLTGIYADDGYTITIQPSGATFDAPEHWAHMHPVVELTSGMSKGSNTFTLIVQNWMGLSMSYGTSDGLNINQMPYIVQVNDPAISLTAAKASPAALPSFITKTDKGLIVNGTVIKT